MRRLYQAVFLAAIVAAVSGLVLRGVWSTLSTTRVVRISELRAGSDFILSGVRFRQVGFSEIPGVADVVALVTFELDLADGTLEVIEFCVGFYCSAGTVGETRTLHSNPAVVLRYACGDDAVLVRVV